MALDQALTAGHDSPEVDRLSIRPEFPTLKTLLAAILRAPSIGKSGHG